MVKESIVLSSIESVKKFVSITTKYDFQINLTTDKYKIDAKSIMGVITLGATYKTKILCSCNGPDEEEAMEALQALFERRFEQQ